MARRGKGPDGLYSDEKCSSLLKEYESGKTLKALAALEGVSVSTIHRAILKAGGTFRPRGRKKVRATKGILSWLDETPPIVVTDELIRERYEKLPPQVKADIQAAIRQALT